MPTRSPTGSLLRTFDTPLTYGRSREVSVRGRGYRYRATIPLRSPSMTHVHDQSAPDQPTADTAAGEVRPRWKREVGLFLVGQTTSLFGSMLVQYAVMWHLTLETKSGGVMALAALFGFLPQA